MRPGKDRGGTREPEGRPEPLVARGYRLLLWLYPPSLRREHGDEMVEAVRRRWRARREGLKGHPSGPGDAQDGDGMREGGDRGLVGGIGMLPFLLRTWALAVLASVGAWWDRGLRRLGIPGVGLRELRRRGGRRHAGSGVLGRGLLGERLRDLGQELGITVRSLKRTPAFTTVAVLTLALGIGANTAIFSVVDAVLLEPLPYPESGRLHTMIGGTSWESPWTYTEILLDLEGSTEAFEDIAGYYPRPFSVTGGDRPVEIEGAQVTPDFFRTLGVEIVEGRGFLKGDVAPGAPPTAIISHGLWERRYGGSLDVLGRTVAINGRLHEIVGVTEPGFRQMTPRTGDPRLWIPFELRPTGPGGTLHWAIPVVRLRSGVPVERGQAELDAATARFRERHPDRDSRRWHLGLVTLKSRIVGDVRPALMVLQFAVGLVLLLACVNVANLLLVRASSREQEMAVRSALGASRGRLIRQLLTESLVIAVLGGLAGLILLLGGLQLIVAIAPGDVPRIGEASVDVTVFAFTLGISVLTGLGFGVVPALTGARQSPSRALKEDGRTAAGSVRRHRISRSLVVAEVALTLVLLVGAGLLVRSFVSLTAQDPGFRTRGVLSMQLNVPENRFDSVPELEAHYRRIVQRLEGVAGIESVAMANNLPIRRSGSTRDYEVELAGAGSPSGEEGRAADASGGAADELPVAEYGVVSPGYFRTLEIPLLRGRAFQQTDRRGSPRVAIVDETMWREAWPDADPVGKRFSFQDDPDSWVTVVGVVGETRGGGLDRSPAPGFYVPYQQRPATEVELAVGRDVVVLARPRPGMDPLELAAPLRRALWDVDPDQPVAEIATLENVMSEAVGPERFRALLSGGFAVLAVLLAVAGIYGVIEYLVAERTREFGIRVAMGATGGDILRRVLRWGLGVTAAGVVVGLGGVFAVSRYLESLLFGVSPTDPVTVAGSVTVVVLVALAACLVPARRATRVDPVAALRTEGPPPAEAAG